MADYYNGSHVADRTAYLAMRQIEKEERNKIKYRPKQDAIKGKKQPNKSV